jgi:hypothetical protein
VWKICQERGDIYLGTYTGWYDVREEKYIPEVEAKLLNYRDPVTNKPLLKMQVIFLNELSVKSFNKLIVGGILFF